MNIAPALSLTIALTEKELAAFFPGELREQLLAIAPNTRVVAAANSQDLNRRLIENRTNVLLSGWSTPSLQNPPDAASPLPDLEYVCHLTGTVRRLVPRPRIENGLRVSNWGDGAAETVAEGALMLILSALRRTQFWGCELHDRGGWRSGSVGTRTLFDRRIAIHGFGRIARAMLPLLAPFRTTIVAYSEGVPPEYIRGFGVEPVSTLEALFRSGADVLIEIEALTPQSRGTVREEHLRLLRPGAIFVNSGRGAVVDEEALTRIALEGNLHFALDVYATEPLPANSKLRGLPNVTLMPHTGGPTEDRYPAIGQFALDNLRRWRDGEPLLAEVDLTVYDAST